MEEVDRSNEDAEKLESLLFKHNPCNADDGPPLQLLFSCICDPFINTTLEISSLSCLISISIAATSLIVGRSSGEGCTHSIATPRVCIISWISGSGLCRKLGSNTSPPCILLRRTQSTMWSPSSMVGSIGCLPVNTSSITTPKLYTSLFSVIFIMYPYSAHHPKSSRNGQVTSNKLTLWLVN